MSKLLSVRRLTTSLLINRQPFSVVHDLSFDLERGKTLAIVGESGCGKSMTALSLARLLPPSLAVPSTGQILFKDTDLLKISEKEMRKIRGNRLSMIFQDPTSSLNPLYTIGFQLREVIEAHKKIPEYEMEAMVIQALADVKLPSPKQIINCYPHQLSGGMLQRVMIAMALILTPDLLIADEPTTALDLTIQAQILQLLKDLQKNKGMAIILITHDMNVVAEMADEVLVMYASEKIEEAKVEDLFDNPAHPYTQKLFQAQPNHPLSQKKLPTIRGRVPPLSEKPDGCLFHPRCDQAMPLCKKSASSFFSLPEEKHWAKCWLYDQQLDNPIDDEASFRS
jgi:oligopeptide/dipeptide ABC transporter ATP-binding protein